MPEKTDAWLSETILELYRYAESHQLDETARYLRDAFFASFYERLPPDDEPQDESVRTPSDTLRQRGG